MARRRFDGFTPTIHEIGSKCRFTDEGAMKGAKLLPHAGGMPSA
jgi:hypothetical protein